MKLSTIAIATSAALSVSVFAADATIQPIHQGYSDTAPYYEVDGNVVSNTDLYAYLWNPRGKTKEQIIERALFLAEAYDVERTEAQVKRAQKAQQDYEGSIVINSVMPTAVGFVSGTEDNYAKGLKRNRDAGVTLTSSTVFAFPGDGDMPVLERIDKSTKVMNELGLEIVKDTDTIRQAKADGKMAVMFNSQGADYVIEDMEMVKKVKLRGLHAANFTYNRNNALAGGGTKQGMGVTDLGKKFIEYANANGVIVDVSHSSNQAAIDAAKYSKKPIIASHSNAAAIHNVSRNMSDEAIKAVGATGGAICTTGVGMFMDPEGKGKATPEIYAKHVEYTANLIGRDKTCFSTDYMHNALDIYTDFVANVDVYPPEKGFAAPVENLAAENVWDVVAVLEDTYGWSKSDIRGFLGENLMRVYAANWN